MSANYFHLAPHLNHNLQNAKMQWTKSTHKFKSAYLKKKKKEEESIMLTKKSLMTLDH